jgi:hypothetical protein
VTPAIGAANTRLFSSCEPMRMMGRRRGGSEEEEL